MGDLPKIEALSWEEERLSALLTLKSKALPALPENHVGLWMQDPEETLSATAKGRTEVGLRFQTRSGIFIDLCIPRRLLGLKLKEEDVDNEEALLLQLSEQKAAAGLLSIHNTPESDIALRQHVVDFHPATGRVDVSRVQGQEDGSFLMTEDLLDASGCSQKNPWHRVGGPSLDGSSVAAFELVEDKQGRQGFWIVIGTWFGRVVGRKAGDILSDTACKSLPHFVKSYAELLQVEPEAAVQGFEAAFGRVEAPGIFRVVHDLDPVRNGSLLLDDATRQLKRDSVKDDVLIESSTKHCWRIREFSRAHPAFQGLKRVIA